MAYGISMPGGRRVCSNKVPPPLQKGDIILSINGVSLLGKSHAEAIQVIKSAVPLSVVRIELIQGEETVENGGLSPDWCKWLAKYESGHSRLVLE